VTWPTEASAQFRWLLNYIRERYERGARIERWARAEAERTQPPICDRPSCYDGPDTVASRIEHGCVPDWKRP
jgi:hypothetical protein